MLAGHLTCLRNVAAHRAGSPEGPAHLSHLLEAYSQQKIIHITVYRMSTMRAANTGHRAQLENYWDKGSRDQRDKFTG